MIRFTLISLAVVLTTTCAAQNAEIPVYIGTYTKKEGHVDGKAKGIFLALQDPENGSLHPEKTVAKITNPSFVKASKDGKNLYVVSELGGGDAESGFIYSFKRNSDNSLEELGKISTESFAPCHIEIDKSGNYVFVSNYMGGVVMVYKRGEDGNLEKQQKIQLENPGALGLPRITPCSFLRFQFLQIIKPLIFLILETIKYGCLILMQQPGN